MLRHIVIWNYVDGFSDEENLANAKRMKSELENLKHLVPTIREIKFIINPLPSSSGDVMLDSLFEDEAALAAYQVHLEHQRVSNLVGTMVKNKKCIDYLE